MVRIQIFCNFSILSNACFKVLLVLITPHLEAQKETDIIDSGNYAEQITAVNDYINGVQNENGIPGIALAIIKKGRVIHQNYYGYASIEHRAPIHEKTTFRLYSLTKLFVAVATFQLFEQKQLSLNDSIGKYLPDIPVSWRDIQIGHLLSYSSGLPELLSPYTESKDLSVDTLAQRIFNIENSEACGERFQYNQTDYWLLQQCIETRTNSSISDFIFGSQVDSSVFFSSDSRDIIINRATPYFPFDKNHITITHPYFQGDFSHGLNGLHLTLNSFIQWDQRFCSNKILNKETKTVMWSEFPYEKDDSGFCYGWAKYNLDSESSFGFSGSGCVAYRVFPDSDLSIIYLTNGFSKQYAPQDVIQAIKTLTDKI